MFAEPRNDIHDVAVAIARLVRAEGSQSLNGVFRRLRNYIHLTRGDLRRSLTRSGDLMWYTAARNVARAQNRDPKYAKYRPIPNCPLEYVGGLFVLREFVDQSDAHDARHIIQRSLFDEDHEVSLTPSE